MREKTMNLFGEPDDVKRCRQRGHAAVPGTGPPGEKCGTCKHPVRVALHSKVIFKCNVMHHSWTNGAGTDIRLKDPACRWWEARKCPA